MVLPGRTKVARRVAATLVAAAVLTGAAACTSTSAPVGTAAAGTASATATPTPTPKGTIVVFAAASLKPTFTALATKFEAANPGTTVTLNFAGSSDLVTQITSGAPADVFASADAKNMKKLTDASEIMGTPVNFATNTLEIAVPLDNPAHVSSFGDLGKARVRTVICAPQVPCGAATATIETATSVTIPAVSEESSVTDVLGKVASGEADAGLVYVTDVKASGSTVLGVPFAEASQAVNTYPIGVVATTKNQTLSEAFIAYVTGSVGRGVLQAAGFGAVP
ncbi:molybdate ABC transporter substrate-binding protein [Subtercola sp. PAMC28395]|uniref:molybdate ABC transporter substrate-binding protein n=1 Tax=Subtercola sp. PAMC28395 TaxID=2846775 RepID=UPI00352D66ED